ncbi:hypothetical protein [Amycolatopsis magusensis]|uniref:hypothetical protein n=1 Tax=Amycolatopsis magusensis TaxID=882444 RepID=UPI0024A9C69A|nr:hypothetical protein [Amycolatopsis magusensis]MDI5976859.1 hypothetical protein [Amycolatopsis magusensis]
MNTLFSCWIEMREPGFVRRGRSGWSDHHCRQRQRQASAAEALGGDAEDAAPDEHRGKPGELPRSRQGFASYRWASAVLSSATKVVFVPHEFASCRPGLLDVVGGDVEPVAGAVDRGDELTAVVQLNWASTQSRVLTVSNALRSGFFRWWNFAAGFR